LHAVQALLASITLQPANAHAHLLLSRIFRGQRKLTCALHHVRQLLLIQGDNVDALAALAFLLQHASQQAPFESSHAQISRTLTSDVEKRLCAALHSVAAVHNVLLPPSICFLASPALLAPDATYSTQWSTFFRSHMPGHMLSNNYVPGRPLFFLPSS
jgi:hypothetical protein